MISGIIAGSNSFTVYPLGEITIQRLSYYISYTPSSASGTMWIKSNSTATPVSYQLSSYSGMLKFSNNYTQYLSFESCTWSSIETNIPMFNESLTFARCSTLQNADLYNCTSLSLRTFQYCTSLSQVSLPVCSYIGSSAFAYCSSLSQISLPVCEVIKDAAFNSCSSLSIITIGYSGVCSLGILAFNNTKITSSTGSIYVPASLVSAYKSATNWSYFSAIIQSYPGL